MNEIFCHSFTEIIQNYIKHLQLLDSTSHKLISSDLPNNKCIGFTCCDDHYLIKIDDLKKNAHRVRDQKWNFLLTKDRIISSTGRIELANIFNQFIKTSIRDLDKYFELKAFW